MDGNFVFRSIAKRIYSLRPEQGRFEKQNGARLLRHQNFPEGLERRD